MFCRVQLYYISWWISMKGISAVGFQRGMKYLAWMKLVTNKKHCRKSYAHALQKHFCVNYTRNFILLIHIPIELYPCAILDLHLDERGVRGQDDRHLLQQKTRVLNMYDIKLTRFDIRPKTGLSTRLDNNFDNRPDTGLPTRLATNFDIRRIPDYRPD